MGGGSGSGGGMAGGGAPINIQLGDLHIHPVGGAQFSDDQLRMMTAQHADTQAKTIANVTRNLPAIIRKSGGYSGG